MEFQNLLIYLIKLILLLKGQDRKKYRVIFTPPYTLIESYSKHFKNKKIIIGSQNCYQKDHFSSNTAAVSPFMIKSVGAQYTLVAL